MLGDAFKVEEWTWIQTVCRPRQNCKRTVVSTKTTESPCGRLALHVVHVLVFVFECHRLQCRIWCTMHMVNWACRIFAKKKETKWIASLLPNNCLFSFSWRASSPCEGAIEIPVDFYLHFTKPNYNRMAIMIAHTHPIVPSKFILLRQIIVEHTVIGREYLRKMYIIVSSANFLHAAIKLLTNNFLCFRPYK